ncbi:MAG: hypothetical protein CVU47_00565 [Chloroflexi bacterium HGW-Chloroflexi-9]|nr:MAG: hypothetical protein CVU47_00565 [Chloroflexi bacterium HGW-Chloroflexi-9]
MLCEFMKWAVEEMDLAIMAKRNVAYIMQHGRDRYRQVVGARLASSASPRVKPKFPAIDLGSGVQRLWTCVGVVSASAKSSEVTS